MYIGKETVACSTEEEKTSDTSLSQWLRELDFSKQIIEAEEVYKAILAFLIEEH